MDVLEPSLFPPQVFKDSIALVQQSFAKNYESIQNSRSVAKGTVEALTAIKISLPSFVPLLVLYPFLFR